MAAVFVEDPLCAGHEGGLWHTEEAEETSPLTVNQKSAKKKLTVWKNLNFTLCGINCNVPQFLHP